MVRKIRLKRHEGTFGLTLQIDQQLESSLDLKLYDQLGHKFRTQFWDTREARHFFIGTSHRHSPPV